MGTSFSGDSKHGASILWPYERRLIDLLAPRVPRWIESYHLTIASVPLSFLIVLFGYLAQFNIHWLWASSLTIVAQYFTDSLDGELGKRRGMGLKRWGYFMDHFLDYVFLCAIIYGYSFLIPTRHHDLIMLALILCAGFMINSYLLMAAADTFQISFLGMGPTEGRLAAIANNILMIAWGPVYIMPALPYLLAAGAVLLIIVVYRTQRHILKLDRLSGEP